MTVSLNCSYFQQSANSISDISNYDQFYGGLMVQIGMLFFLIYNIVMCIFSCISKGAKSLQFVSGEDVMIVPFNGCVD